MKINNIIFKDVKEFNIIFLILISIFLVGISGYSSYAIFSDEIVSNNEIKGIIKKQATGSDTILKKVGTDGLVADTHPATTQLGVTTDYRYTGANPNNYIRFNDETWRIIGVFEVDDGTGKLEKRIKIIRKNMKVIPWDRNAVNDWTKASGMTLLNSGDYYNRKGMYIAIGLTEEAKSMIDDAKWYLGGTNQTQTTNATQFYSYERGTTVFEGRPTSWVGKVGLMYPSDYGYATSGGATTNRDTCLAKAMYTWDSSSLSDCNDNNWLYVYDNGSVNHQWTITPVAEREVAAFYVHSKGIVTNDGVSNYKTFSPTIYLKSDIEITGGTGTSSDPYTLPGPLRSTPLINKVGTDGLVREEHPAKSQIAVATTAYRYTGKNPNNYIKFNNEVWRIIGIFDTDDGTGKLEKRIKIIRDSLGDIEWDSSDVNDWTKASAKTLLNSGDYYNRTGSYASNGLTTDAKSQIANAKWYLGGISNFTDATYGLTSHIYGYERGTTVYSGRPISWIGKVGLMYPSDYGYATSGGTTTSRNACLAKEMYNWDSSSVSDCKNNNWLYNNNNHQWTLTHKTSASNTTFFVANTGGLNYESATFDFALCPTVYLSYKVSVTGGNGTISEPYTISLSN